ncbi:hypothetical protein GCM10028787_24460 [Brachybacterium horti]
MVCFRNADAPLARLQRESRWADRDRSAFTADSRSHVSVDRKPAKGSLD